MDNECSIIVKCFVTQQQNTKIQFVKTHQHRVNSAEHAIQAFKNHFIAVLRTVHKYFPLQLWDELLDQAVMSLNLLLRSCINPKLSAYAVLKGNFICDKTPLSPPGTKALVYTDPTQRKKWEVHAKDAWYVGRLKDHYRRYKFSIPQTGGYQIAKTA